RTITEEEGRKYLTYSGSYAAILKAAGYKSDGKDNYAFLKNAITLLHSAQFKLTTKSGITDLTHMIHHVTLDKRHCTISLDEYFYVIYIAGSFTLIDVA